MATEDTQERAHARLAPSSASQWRHCPGSVSAEEQYEDITGFAAAQGTLFHEFAEVAFSCGFEPHHFRHNIGQIFEIEGHEIEFDQEMIDCMYEGLDWLNEQVEDDAVILTEERVPTGTYTLEEGGFGTSDNIIMLPTSRRMIVQDWKYGRIAVSPIENDQMFIYCLGAWDEYGWKVFGNPEGVEVWFKIDQPRANGGGGLWRTTMEAVLKEGDKIIEDARRVWEEPDLRIPGTKQCLFCSHGPNCKELFEFNLDKAQMTFDDLDEFDFDQDPKTVEWPKPEPAMSPEHRSALIAHFPVYKRWIDKLSAEALEDAHAGRPTPLYKLVEGRRPARKYKSGQEKKAEKVLAQTLGEDAYVIKPLSPAQAQTELGKTRYMELIAPYVEQGDGKLQLVLDTDNRDTMPPLVEKFDVL